MKRILPAIIALLMLCGCANTVKLTTYSAQPTLDASSGYKQWTSQDMTAILTYPHTWYANENVSALLQLVSSAADLSPDYREYIVLGVFENTENSTIEQIADKSVADMQEIDSAISLTESGTRTVSGIIMQKRVFGGHTTSSTIGAEGDYVWQQLSWLAGQYSFSITFSCTKAMLNEYTPVFDFVLDNAELDYSLYN